MDRQQVELNSADTEAISHLRQAINGGKHWYVALLEAIKLWQSSEETYNERHYRYLIDGEAFDWLLLAERLCGTINDLVPEDEKMALLFHGKPPMDITGETFRELIGTVKYHQYLNYFYGVAVEEALILAVQEEVRKEKRVSGINREEDVTNEVYRRIYGDTRDLLLGYFRQEKGYPHRQDITLNEIKEFNYWLFKYRLKHSEKAKVASDTKKGLDWLNKFGISRQLVKE